MGEPVFCHEFAEVRCAGLFECVTFCLFSEAYAVHHYEQYWFHSCFWGLVEFINNGREYCVMQEIEHNIESTRKNLEEVESVSRSSIDGKLAELNSRLEELEVEVFNDEERERSLSDQVQALRSEVDRLEGSSAEERLNEFEEELIELKTQIDESDSENSVESDEIDDLWETLDKEFSEVERRMHENEAELDELRSDVAHISEVLRQVISKNLS